MSLTFSGPSGIMVLILYAVAMLCLGYFAGRKNPLASNSLKGYYLAGRDLGLVALFFTLYATQYSGNAVIGYAPTAYRSGFLWWQSVTFMIAVIVAYLLFAPRLYIIARRNDFITPINWIHYRFRSKPLAIVITFLLLWGLGNYLLEQLVAMGQGISGLTGNTVPYQVGVVGFILVMLIYSWVGGMRAVAFTDVMQGIALLVGIVSLLGGGLYLVGGVQEVMTHLARDAPEKITVPATAARINWISMVIMVGLAASMYPHAIQRVYATRNERTLRRSLAGMAWMPLVTTAFTFVIGIICIALYPGLSDGESERVVGRLANDVASINLLMYLLMVMLFGGVVAAIVSTADSALLSFSSMVSRDIYGAYLSKGSDEGKQVKIGKYTGIAAIVVLLGIAWSPPGTLYQIFVLKLELLVQISPAFILGLYWRKLSAVPVLVGVLAGTALVGYFALIGTRSPSGLPNGIIGLGLNLVICITGSLLRPDAFCPELTPSRVNRAG